MKESEIEEDDHHNVKNVEDENIEYNAYEENSLESDEVLMNEILSGNVMGVATEYVEEISNPEDGFY